MEERHRPFFGTNKVRAPLPFCRRQAALNQTLSTKKPPQTLFFRI